jgi:hypothetical protein
VVSNKKIFKISTNQNTLWALAAMLDFRLAPKTQKLARNVHWMVLYQICVFGADLKSNMAARVHNAFLLAEIFQFKKNSIGGHA